MLMFSQTYDSLDNPFDLVIYRICSTGTDRNAKRAARYGDRLRGIGRAIDIIHSTAAERSLGIT